MKIRFLGESVHARRAVLAFSGWTDAGSVVQQVIAEIATNLTCRPAAELDLDGFWHTEVMRPDITVQHGHIKHLTWPAYELSLAVSAEGNDPLVLGSGPEPSCRWRAFSEQLLELLKAWGCTEIYLLGSLNDHILHDEIILSGVAHDTHGLNLLHEHRCRLIDYEGPSAIQSALMEKAPEAGMRALGLWAHLPFYLKGPHELLVARYLQLLGKLLGLSFSVDHLEKLWEGKKEAVESIIEKNEELQAFLDTLKERKRQQKASTQEPSKIVRLDEFLKRRNGLDSDDQ